MVAHKKFYGQENTKGGDIVLEVQTIFFRNTCLGDSEQ